MIKLLFLAILSSANAADESVPAMPAPEEPVSCRHAFHALRDYETHIPAQRYFDVGSKKLPLSYHGQNRWALIDPEDHYAHSAALMFAMTPTPDDSRVLYLAVHGSASLYTLGGELFQGGVSIAHLVNRMRVIGQEVMGKDPFQEAKFIVLLSCNGAEEYRMPGKANSRAKRLSYFAKLPVLAPDGLIATYHSPASPLAPSVFTVAHGAFNPWSPNFEKQGTWKIQSLWPITPEQEVVGFSLLQFYQELAEDAEKRIVTQPEEDMHPLNPVQRFVYLEEKRRFASFNPDPATVSSVKTEDLKRKKQEEVRKKRFWFIEALRPALKGDFKVLKGLFGKKKDKEEPKPPPPPPEITFIE